MNIIDNYGSLLKNQLIDNVIYLHARYSDQFANNMISFLLKDFTPFEFNNRIFEVKYMEIMYKQKLNDCFVLKVYYLNMEIVKVIPIYNTSKKYELYDFG